MRLTNEEKYHNTSLQTGVSVIEAKVVKLQGKVTDKEEELVLLRKIENPRPLVLARITVAENDIKMLHGFIKQLNKSVETLNVCKFEK